MSNGNDQQFGGYPPGSYDQQGGYSEYGYPQDQAFDQGNGGYQGNQSQGGYAPQGYPSDFGGYDQYNQPQPPQGYQDQGGYANDPYNAPPEPSPYSQYDSFGSSSGSADKTKMLVFAVLAGVAIISMIGFILELGVVGSGLKPSSWFGMGEEAVSYENGFEDCSESGGQVTTTYPESCSINDTTYYKQYSEEEKAAAKLAAERAAAERGQILLVPTDWYLMDRTLEIDNIENGVSEGVVTYTYRKEGEEGVYQMYINNSFLPSGTGENEVLVSKAKNFIAEGNEYDGEESLVMSAFKQGDQIADTVQIGSLEVEYSGVDSLRAIYAIDGKAVGGWPVVRVFAEKGDNVIMLEKFLTLQEMLDYSSEYLTTDCPSTEMDRVAQRECYHNKLEEDQQFQSRVEQIAQDLVVIFALE